MSRLLRYRDYTFIVARSPASFSRTHLYFQEWVDAQHLAIELAQKCYALDPNGITVYFASQPYQVEKQTNPQALARVFQVTTAPEAIDLVDCLKAALFDYFQRRNANRTENGEVILVFLDQVQPQERKLIAQMLIESSRNIQGNTEADSSYELGISFIQVGSDSATRKFLKFLDDDLVQAGAKHDLVDRHFWYEINRRSLEQLLVDALLD